MESRRKRKALSDITNTFGLIPTSHLVKLVHASKPPDPILMRSDSNSTTRLFGSESTNRSDTSIGSSNVAAGACKPRTVRFRTPPLSITTPDTEGGGTRSTAAAYNRKHVNEKSMKEREDVVIVSPPLEKSKKRGKAISAPFSSSHPEKQKDNQNEICSSGNLVEKEKQKGKAYRNLFSGLVEKVKEPNKGGLNSYSPLYGKTEKGKAVLNSSGCAIGNQEEMEKEDVVIVSRTSVEKRKDKGKAISVPFSRSPPEKLKDNQSKIRNPSSLLEKEKQKDEAYFYSDPFEIVKESDKVALDSAEFGKSTSNSSCCSVGKQEKMGKDVIDSPTSAEKRKIKGKAIAVPFNSSPPSKSKYDQNESFYFASLLGREKQKGIKIVEKSDEGALNSYSRSSGKKDIGKAILNAIGKREEMGKGIVDHSGYSLEKNVDGKKGIVRNLKTQDREKGFFTPPSFLVEKTEKVGSSIEKTKGKGKAIFQSSDVVEVTKHKGSSAAIPVNCRPPRRKSKRINDAAASSCPPMMKNKNIMMELDEDLHIKPAKSWTDPHPKSRKKRLRIEDTSDLPLDFIKQQRAYFKEVDEFELPEEEISQDESD